VRSLSVGTIDGVTDRRPAPPSHADLVRDLRLLRERGLLRLRRLSLPALSAAARIAGRTDADDDPQAIEWLLRRAVDALGDEEPGEAGRYLFGLVQGTIGRRPTDLRERAAAIYGVSAETFRKERERLLLDRLADEILRLRPAARPVPAATPPAPTAPVVRQVPAVVEVLAELEAALVRARDRSADERPDTRPFGRFGPFALPFAGDTAWLTVDLGAVEELRDVDLLVSSENTYLLPARLFSRTLSGQLRSAAAVRDETGTVVYDPVAEELAAWMARHARTGAPIEPGVVVPTSPGRLREQGVRRLLHAAVAIPRLGAGGYDIPDTGVHRAVRECFALARAERAGDPLVRSLTIPLFGAGDGGLTASASFSRLWPAVQAELTADPSWDVHLTTWTLDEVVVVLDGLLAQARSAI
jgi:hypothetical protein